MVQYPTNSSAARLDPVCGKELIDVDAASMFSLFWLLLIVAGIGWLVKQMRDHKREFSASLKGAIAIVEVDSRNNLLKYNMDAKVYGVDKLTLQGVVLGRAVSQQGSQARIALAGDWVRVDENTIKGAVDTFKGKDHGRYPSRFEWAFTVGEWFPLGFVDGSRNGRYITASSKWYARIIYLYVPGDATSS